MQHGIVVPPNSKSGAPVCVTLRGPSAQHCGQQDMPFESSWPSTVPSGFETVALMLSLQPGATHSGNVSAMFATGTAPSGILPLSLTAPA